MSGETVKYADPHIGLLHRGTEKLLEYKTFLQGVPYFARLDYVSTISQEHVYCCVIENLLNVKVSKNNSYYRIIFLELTRILNHILALTTHALDVGAMTPFLWSFEEREKIMEFYERVSGARMHTTFFRPGGVNVLINKKLIHDIKYFAENFKFRINDILNLLNNNLIWKFRLSDIGIINQELALSCSLSGPLLRSTGTLWDIRKIKPYENYNKVSFNVVVGSKGDCFDRFLVRLEEMRESIYIIEQACNFILKNENTIIEDLKIKNNSKDNIKKSMEYMINHFKYYSEGFYAQEDDCYFSSETPKGEFGVHIESLNSNKPYRVKIRSSGFFNLQVLNYIVKDNMLADVVTIIGTLDLVFGEIDR